MEMGEGRVAQRAFHAGQRRQARDHVGHVGGGAVMRIGQSGRGFVIGGGEIAQAGVAQARAGPPIWRPG